MSDARQSDLVDRDGAGGWPSAGQGAESSTQVIVPGCVRPASDADGPVRRAGARPPEEGRDPAHGVAGGGDGRGPRPLTMTDDITIAALDEYPLTATLLRTKEPTRAVLIVNSAMAVQRCASLAAAAQ